MSAASDEKRVERTRALLGRYFPQPEIGRFEVRNLGPVPYVTPVGDEAWSQVLTLAAAEGLRCLVVGYGSKLEWCATPREVDLVLSTRHDAALVAYEPGDGTVTARAGMSMARLASVVMEGGHHLTPEVPFPAHASLGGVVGSAADGIDRLRYGPLRHNLLGLKVALADGTIARSGGALVKNVTGYDLHRLLCGSFGTLGVVLEASLRLYPDPETQAVWSVDALALPELLALAESVRQAPLQPLALTISEDRDNEWRLDVLLAARAEVLEFELEQLQALLVGRTGTTASILREREAGNRRRRLGAYREIWPNLRASVRPSRLSALLEQLDAALQSPALGGVTLRRLIHPALAEVRLWIEPDHALGALFELHDALASTGAALQWLRAPDGLDDEVDRFGLPERCSGAAASMMSRLRETLDAQRVFARTIDPGSPGDPGGPGDPGRPGAQR